MTIEEFMQRINSYIQRKLLFVFLYNLIYDENLIYYYVIIMYKY